MAESALVEIPERGPEVPNESSPQFVAEVSSNHNRSIDRAMKFVKASADSGFDAVKFQLFKVDELFAPEILKNSEEHQNRRLWELPLDFVPELSNFAHELGLQFGATPFYLDAVEELNPWVDFYKVASYEILWEALLSKCGQTGKPVVVSSGMASLEEVKSAVKVLRLAGCSEITVLHCSSAYPTPRKQANLAAIKTLRSELGVPVGWSDHTRDRAVVMRATQKWGASFVEMHLDLDRSGSEYEAGHCWLPEEAREVIDLVRQGLEADGTGEKVPNPAELPDLEWRRDPTDGLRPMKSARITAAQLPTGRKN